MASASNQIAQPSTTDYDYVAIPSVTVSGADEVILQEERLSQATQQESLKVLVRAKRDLKWFGVVLLFRAESQLPN